MKSREVNSYQSKVKDPKTTQAQDNLKALSLDLVCVSGVCVD